jgi:integrase
VAAASERGDVVGGEVTGAADLLQHGWGCDRGSGVGALRRSHVVSWSRVVLPDKPLDMHNFARRDWHPALDAAGIRPRRLYDLRHWFASNALAAGISQYELSRYMGASVRVLEMHYAHLVRGCRAECPGEARRSCGGRLGV